MGLDAFEGKDMPPHVFKEQLKMTFNIQVGWRWPTGEQQGTG